MYKRGIMMLLGASFLSACGASNIEVIQLDYIEDQWNVESYSKEGEMIEVHESKEVLAACVGERATELKGDITVYQTAIAGRTEPVSAMTPYTMKVVTYLEGDERYVVCRESYTNQLMAEVIDSFPDFVNTSDGIRLPQLPSIHQTSSTLQDELVEAEGLDIDGKPITPFPHTLLEIEPALYGELEIKLGGKAIRYPISQFEPRGFEMPNQQIAIGYDKKTFRPYILYSFDGQFFMPQPIEFDELEDPESKENTVFSELEIKTVATARELNEGEEIPFYTFSYLKKGKRVAETMTIRFVPGTLLKDGEEPDPMFEDWLPVEEAGPRAIVHRQPYDGESMDFAEYSEATKDESEELFDMINEAEPVDRHGDVSDFRYLTLTDGWKGQVFEISYQKRSKKIDIYLTDSLRDQTFKLSSKGAQKFLDVFPRLKETL
ncbi:hypothetical protein [Exiguobacterium sp. s22]|uniref:hypothetical protein n=1 Tax=Exiguobacterium sp. s22 TaxID=2751272 RepID=UPI001BE7DB73|nr:hypothetical protein [Exiguobacterium sp. s22]